jgi:TPR repeat protein
MHLRRFAIGTLAAGFLVFSSALLAGMPDPPGDFFPGKYYEWKAHFYLGRKQYGAALDMFQLSGYWADKMSQYNAGVMLFNGIGVPKDRARGVAWLRIAAESHQDLPVATYNAALGELDAAERSEAARIWQELDRDYGDKVTLQRAIDRYLRDKHGISNYGIPDADLQVSEVGTYTVNMPSAQFMEQKQAELDALIQEINGSVRVGAVRTLDVDENARRGASNKVIELGGAPSKTDPQP